MSRHSIQCNLYPDKLCSECDECDRCDLDSTKICDSCGDCLGLNGAEYGEIIIDGILESESEVEEYVLTGEESRRIHRMDSELMKDRAGDYEFIEDIPELKSKYDKTINSYINKEN